MRKNGLINPRPFPPDCSNNTNFLFLISSIKEKGVVIWPNWWSIANLVSPCKILDKKLMDLVLQYTNDKKRGKLAQ